MAFRPSMCRNIALSVNILVLLSCATSTSTGNSCDATASTDVLVERTQSTAVILAGSLLKKDASSVTLKVYQVLKGDAELHKKKIRISIPDEPMAPLSDSTSRDPLHHVTTTALSGGSSPVVAVTVSLPFPCISGASVGDKVIVFVEKSGSSRRRFELVYDVVLQSRKTIKNVKAAIEEAAITSIPDQVDSTTEPQIDDDIVTTNTTFILPKTSDSHFEECPTQLYRDHWCLNGGICYWVSGISRASCECVNNYEGERCEFKALEDASGRPFGDYWEVFIIGTIFGIVILLSLIVAIVYVVRKRRQTHARRQLHQQEADEFIRTNYRLGDEDSEQPDANQNRSADKYVKLPTAEAYPIVETATENEVLAGMAIPNAQNSSAPFRLNDPPFRKASNHSTHSSSKESTV